MIPTTPNTSKVGKAKRAQSTMTARDKRQRTNSAAPSSSSFSSAAAQAHDDDADVMDYAPTEAPVVDDDSTPEERAMNDEVMRKVAEEIVSGFNAPSKKACDGQKTIF